MTARRVFFFTLVLVTMIWLTSLLVQTLSVDGYSWLDFTMTLLFIIFLPWSTIGFWNATTGFLVMRMSANPVAAVLPVATQIRGDEPILHSTAILLCIRNEVVETVFRNIRATMDGLGSSPAASRFHLYILSDTTDELIAHAEEEEANALKSRYDGNIAVTYRRREVNTDFKAGNIRDFCERWGADHDFMITLDADSYMSSQAILRLVRIMQVEPRLGILQHLTVGLPSTSAFARTFQFGMRLGMRSYTVGSAWWQGECGPYWGHNAIIRMAPFIAHCDLPKLPGSGPLSGSILSHDQVEAVMIRRAGYECRVLPQEDGSFEENPTTLLEFIRRDLRWCHGNMQYLKLLGMKGARPISQYQLCFAILMFIGAPASILFTLIAALRLGFASDPSSLLDIATAKLLAFLFLGMSLAPKFATLADVLLTRASRARFGNIGTILASAVIETVFSFLILPIMTVSEALFLANLALGKAAGWGTQLRADHQVSFSEAKTRLWPHTLIGLTAWLWFYHISPAAFWWTLPFTLGLVISIPLAIFSSAPRMGRTMMRYGLCRLPEETEMPEDLIKLGFRR